MTRSLFVRSIPKPTRKEILALAAKGLSTREIANQYEISDTWVRRVKQEFREEGKTKNATTRKRRPLWEPLIPRIQSAIADQPDLTLKELKALLGTELSEGTLCRALRHLRLTFKKKL